MFSFKDKIKDRYADDSEDELRDIIEKANANRAEYVEPPAAVFEVEEISSVDDLSQDELKAMLQFMPQYDEWVEDKEQAVEKVDSAFDTIIIPK